MPLHLGQGCESRSTFKILSISQNQKKACSKSNNRYQCWRLSLVYICEQPSIASSWMSGPNCSKNRHFQMINSHRLTTLTFENIHNENAPTPSRATTISYFKSPTVWQLLAGWQSRVDTFVYCSIQIIKWLTFINPSKNCQRLFIFLCLCSMYSQAYHKKFLHTSSGWTPFL